jgi:serine/threonine-protein kinase
VTGEPALALEPGTVFAGYRVERVLGRGGMGVVYEAVQLSLDRPVALKIVASEFSRDPAYRERFKREARLAAALEHPNVLPVHEHGEGENGLLYLSMRLTRGMDLREYLAGRGSLGPGETVRLLTPVAEALDAAHAAGMVHRDVKPGNILLEQRDGERRVYLTDFGLARRVDADIGEHTTAGQLVGTPHYMAPEQISGGPIDGRADVYALGCLLYRCLVGRVPFDRPNVPSTILAHLQDPPPKPSGAQPNLPPVFDLIVARALEKEPERRARSAGALMRRAAADLERASSTPPRPPTRPVSTAPVTPPAPPAPRRRGRPLAAAMSVVALLAAVAIAVGAVLLAGTPKNGSGTAGGDLEALSLTSETVRLAGQTGALAQRMSGAGDSAGISAVGPALAETDRSWGRLRKRTRAELRPRNPAVDDLVRAQRLGGQAVGALATVARAPATPGNVVLVETASRRYAEMLTGLRSATRVIRGRLDAAGSLSAGDRSLLMAIGEDLAAGRTTARARFEALRGVVEGLGGG